MIMFCGQTAMWRCIHCAIDEAGNLLKPSERETSGGVRSLQRINSESVLKADHGQANRVPDRPQSPAQQRHSRHGSYSATHRACRVWDKIHDKSRSTVAKLLLPNNPKPNLANASLRNQFVAYIDEAVAPFNTRNFTHQSDVVPAFEGIANFLEQGSNLRGSIYSGGLCWGLPLAYFPQALTWTTKGEDLRPRDPSLGFPTWSWFAWEGSVAADKLFFPAESPISFIIPDSEYESKIEWGFTLSTWDRSSSSDPAAAATAAAPGGRHCPRGIRLVAPRSVVRPEDGRLYRGTSTGWPFHWISRDVSRPAILLADRPSELGVDYYATSQVQLVFIAKFEAAVGFSSGDPVLSARFVKALWVTRLDPSPAVEEELPGRADCGGGGKYLRVRRLGVAIVHYSLWDRYAEPGGQRLVTILE